MSTVPQTWTPQPGELVWAVNHQGREVPAQVVANRPGGSSEWDVYDVRVLVQGVIPVGREDLRPVEVTPARGQRWRAITKAGLVLAVVSVDCGGLIANCVTPSGAYTGVCLLGNYTLIGADR